MRATSPEGLDSVTVGGVTEIADLYSTARWATSMKMPTQRFLTYSTGAISSVAWTGIGNLNIARDLAATNRHNVTMTSGKGVPYVFRLKITASPNVTAQDKNQVFSEDSNLIQVLSVSAVPQTWVARNAGVKMHYARENMFKQQGVRKKERGSYSKTIRYTWDADPDTFLTPKHGVGSLTDYNMGTWDYTAVKTDDAQESHIQVMSADGLLSMYLDSRKQIRADSNSDSDDTNLPTDDSLIRRLLSPTLGISSQDDEITALARDEQDNPPYQLDNDGDAIAAPEVARLFIGPEAGITSSVVVDAPYGLLDLQALNAYKDSGNTITAGFGIKVELLGIYEM